jgi:hypothetical protein
VKPIRRQGQSFLRGEKQMLGIVYENRKGGVAAGEHLGRKSS